MIYEWDQEKAESNALKHRIDFETASRVFLDLNRIEEYDSQHNETEDRRQVTGMVTPAVIVVIFTERGETICIISARKANEQERKKYYTLRD
jgi:uncharacterized DUF497 family protein